MTKTNPIIRPYVCPDHLHDDDENVRETALSALTHLLILECKHNRFIPTEVIAATMAKCGEVLRKGHLVGNLNALRRAGYIHRVRRGEERGYRMTERGWQAADPDVDMDREAMLDLRRDGLLDRLYKDGEFHYWLNAEGQELLARLESIPKGQAAPVHKKADLENQNSTGQTTGKDTR